MGSGLGYSNVVSARLSLMMVRFQDDPCYRLHLVKVKIFENDLCHRPTRQVNIQSQQVLPLVFYSGGLI